MQGKKPSHPARKALPRPGSPTVDPHGRLVGRWRDPDSAVVWGAPTKVVRRTPLDGSPRVLVAVEDIELADRLAEGFFDAGLDPQPAPSAAEALSGIRRERYDAVVADPRIEGWDVLREWLVQNFDGVVCMVHDLDARPVSVADAAGEADPEAAAVADRLLKALLARGLVKPLRAM